MERGKTKLYRKELNIFWWTHRWTHLKFILRELTSLCVAFFGLEMVVLVNAVLKGEEAYLRYLEFMASPGMLIANFLAIGGLLFHSLTWFDLAPKAMVIKLGKKPVPGVLIAGSNYAGWILVSIALIWILMMGS